MSVEPKHIPLSIIAHGIFLKTALALFLGICIGVEISAMQASVGIQRFIVTAGVLVMSLPSLLYFREAFVAIRKSPVADRNSV